MLRSHEAPDALAMLKFGYRQGSATMHQWFGEWSATFASNRLASPRHRDIGKNFNACIEIFSWCYATVPRGFLSLPMLSRCSNLGIARAAPPCTSGLANDRRRSRVIAMLRQGILTSGKISMHALKFSHRQYIAEHLANIRRCTPRSKMYQTHRRHISDTSATQRRCSCKHRRCIFDVIISPMVWWSIADPSPMLDDVPELRGEASAVLRQCLAER